MIPKSKNKLLEKKRRKYMEIQWKLNEEFEKKEVYKKLNKKFYRKDFKKNEEIWKLRNEIGKLVDEKYNLEIQLQKEKEKNKELEEKLKEKIYLKSQKYKDEKKQIEEMIIQDF